MTCKLSLSTLQDLPDSVARPRYDRADLSPGILHIGVGNFHRAHQAVYLDRLFNKGRSLDWAIIGAGIMPADAARREALKAQDWLTTVMDLSPDGIEARVTGAMIDFVEVDTAKLIEALADPRIRIVTLTVTEGGYFIDETTGGFDAGHPDIRHDAADGGVPKTVFGAILGGLRLRRERTVAPFTVLSCDNLPENGAITRRTVVGLARLMSQELADWVEASVTFPNAMVDCITPATTDRERMLAATRFGIEDRLPVACEPFRQWVIEDNFPTGRPELELVGVELVDDVTPYETMKLRILNAGHAAIAYPSALIGHELVHDAMADPCIRDWLMSLMLREVIPVLPRIEGVDFRAYLAKCVERFSNSEISDRIDRLCQDGSNRQPKFVLPTIAAAAAQGGKLEGLALEVAFWCRYCALNAPMAEGGRLDDPRAAMLHRAAVAAQDDPGRFLALGEVFGKLSENRRFAEAFAHQLTKLGQVTPREVLLDYLERKAA
ncbi:MAG: mannitol dehydrogenase family protein [Alphaproteobacteria bacterium]|nr:MAG: mannitol dehydrogenase family protein [Alphaproteobacteria bacterium]